jgi:hypothetical protein
MRPITEKHCDASDDRGEHEQRDRHFGPAHTRPVFPQGLEFLR